LIFEVVKKINVKSEYKFIAGAAMALLVCYELAFKQTYMAWQRHKLLVAKMEQVSDVTVAPAYLERKSKNLNRLLGYYGAIANWERAETISEISAMAETSGIKVTEVPKPDTSFDKGGFVIQSLVFGGDYFAMLGILHKLEQNKQLGIIRSFTFKTVNTRGVKEEKQLRLEIDFEYEK
jgi:hypothetical protein